MTNREDHITLQPEFQYNIIYNICIYVQTFQFLLIYTRNRTARLAIKYPSSILFIVWEVLSRFWSEILYTNFPFGSVMIYFKFVAYMFDGNPMQNPKAQSVWVAFVALRKIIKKHLCVWHFCVKIIIFCGLFSVLIPNGWSYSFGLMWW